MTAIDHFQTRQLVKPNLNIGMDVFLFALLLGLTLLLRFDHLDYNTIFVDEASNVVVGEEILSGVTTSSATAWFFGSYLYPIIAFSTHKLGGLIALRALPALFSTLAAICVFFSTRRLFGREAALWALFIFGLTGGSISIGQFAAYDALGIPLLAISVFCIVSAAMSHGWKQNALLIIAGLALGLSFLAKYIAVFFLPILIFLGGVLFIWQKKPIRALIFFFLPPALLLIGGYSVYFFQDLLNAIRTQVNPDPLDRMVVLRVTLEQIGIALGAAVIGLPLMVRNLNSDLPYPRRKILVTVILVYLATVSLPIYHIISAASTNVRAVEKHSIYALVLIAPLAGYGIVALMDRLRRYQGRGALLLRSAATVGTVVGLVWFTNYSLDANWGFQHSWPDVSRALAFMRTQGLTPKSLVLASGASTYEYYFDFGPNDRNVWYSTWYFKYKDQVAMPSNDPHSLDAMKQAVEDRAIDFVVLDDYFTPQVTRTLEPVLRQSGYIVGFSEVQRLSNGIITRLVVYVPG